ncbi:MAG: hypothetical protein ABF651_08210 [Sporolactobacillus sp.]
MNNWFHNNSADITEAAELLVQKCDDYNCSYEEGWFHYLAQEPHLRASFDEVMDYLYGELKKAN